MNEHHELTELNVSEWMRALDIDREELRVSQGCRHCGMFAIFPAYFYPSFRDAQDWAAIKDHEARAAKALMAEFWFNRECKKKP